jgi:hypothetical protein
MPEEAPVTRAVGTAEITDIAVISEDLPETGTGSAQEKYYHRNIYSN